MSGENIDKKKILYVFSDIINRLNLTNEKKKETYAVIEEFVSNKISVSSCADTLRSITTTDTFDNQHGLTDHDYSTKQIQTTLYEIFDELWTVTDSEQYIELQHIVEKIRQLFNMLCQKLGANEEKINRCTTQINELEKKINNTLVSEGHLLLDSVAIQILVKMSRYLNRNELLCISACRNFNDINNLDNVDALKSLLETNNFKWEEIRMIIKMLKHNRLPIAHPDDGNTTKADIMNAIQCCYPQVSSSWRKNAEKGLEILEFLATQLQEPLFISIMD